MKWIDMWMSLTKGQRRATLILLAVVAIVGAVQVVVSHSHRNSHDVTADYTVLESEIALFRQSLDTIPPSERPSGYHRRTDSKPDTMSIKPMEEVKSSQPAKHTASPTPQVLEAMPRISGDNTPESENK